MSYNDLMTMPNYILITPLEFGLQQTFTPILMAGDIGEAFRQVGFSVATSLQNLTWFWVGLKGQPLITPDNALKDEFGKPIMAVYAFTQMLFGQKDSPSV